MMGLLHILLAMVSTGQQEDASLAENRHAAAAAVHSLVVAAAQRGWHELHVAAPVLLQVK